MYYGYNSCIKPFTVIKHGHFTSFRNNSFMSACHLGTHAHIYDIGTIIQDFSASRGMFKVIRSDNVKKHVRSDFRYL